MNGTYCAQVNVPDAQKWHISWAYWKFLWQKNQMRYCGGLLQKRARLSDSQEANLLLFGGNEVAVCFKESCIP